MVTQLREALRSFSGLSSANDRAGAAFTVGPVQEIAIAYAWLVYARRSLKKKIQAATVEGEGRLS